MNPVDDNLYRLHKFQASRRGLPPRDYFEFQRRLLDCSDTDLSQLLLPETEDRYRPVVEVEVVYATHSAMARLPWYVMLDAVAFHSAGDWGEVSPQQWLANDRAVASGGRIRSGHRSHDALKFWVVSEGKPRRATITMPEDTWFL